MKQLIVNADDFGYTRGVNAGIVRGFHEGIITSTTIMASGEAFEDALDQARRNPTLGVGCHLVLVGGKTVAPKQHLPHLADGEGNLPPTLGALLSRIAGGSVLLEEIVRELRAQVEKVISRGVQPTHFDSHKHTHAHPRVMEALLKVAEEFGIQRIRKPFEDLRFRGNGGGAASWKQRTVALASHIYLPRFRRSAATHGIRCPQHFWGIAETGRLNVPSILAMIGAMPEGTNELMCHPGEYDSDLETSKTRLKRERASELQALMDPAVREALSANRVNLISFRELN